MELAEIRVRTKIPQSELDNKIGRIVTTSDYNVLLTGPTRVVGPTGQPMAIYLPGAIPRTMTDEHYQVLHGIRAVTDSRGNASGSRSYTVIKQLRSNNVRSATIGSLDKSRSARNPYCRTTAWTGEHTEQFRSLYPLFGHISHLMAQYVPQRFAVQWARAEATDPAWRVAGTPFTTMTVNNTYPTGVHVDKGDLDGGFSCLAVLRRGSYKGGHFTFPEWRFAVDLQDGDLLLMDAHQYHGNTALELESKDAERISLVLYYRTAMLACGTAKAEGAKALASKTKAF
jgi:hypothetical protein